MPALVVHKHKRLGRGIELAMLAEELKASDVGDEAMLSMALHATAAHAQ
ncbi:hypothetical protein [Streptomyces acidicola]